MPSSPTGPVLSFEDKTEQEIRYRQQLLDDLLHQRTYYSSGPYEAHIQFSNFCNMSCIMCWDGRNPPAEKASPELLKKISEQVAPHLSVITPYSGSEPLVWSWDETRDIAQRDSVLLCITTNGQYLDERRFDELKDITETLLVSINSHIPEIFEIIRPGGNVKKVFANLKTIAKLSRQHGVECIVNIVFMTMNAPHLAETVEYLGDMGIESINVIQLLDVNGRSRFYDPLLHFSQEYVDWIKRRCLKTVENKRMRLIWSVAGCSEYDFRPADHVRPLKRKSWNDSFDERMKRMFPGFCRYVLNRLRIDGRGDVAPCCYATQGELSLGNLNEQHFDEIWNGPSAQDLRRGMLCGDVPAHCSSCRYIDPVAPQQQLEFLETVDRDLIGKFRAGKGKVVAMLNALGPIHASRHVEVPDFLVTKPIQSIETYYLVLSFGGENKEIHQQMVSPETDDDELVRFQFPVNIWKEMRANVGFWWNVWAIPSDKTMPIQRLKNSPCVIRNQYLPRIPASNLLYKNKGALPVIDLGVAKQLGWEKPGATPDRPEILKKRVLIPARSEPDVNEYIVHSNPTATSVWNRLKKVIVGDREGMESTQALTRPGNPSVLDGYINQVSEYPEYLHLIGWMLLKDGPADSIEFESKNQQSVSASRVSRPDLEFSFPNMAAAVDGGFEVKLKAKQFKTDFGYEFCIVGRIDDEIVSRVRVTRFATGENETPISGPFWFGKSDRLSIS